MPQGFLAAIVSVAVILLLQVCAAVVGAVSASRDSQAAMRQLFTVVGDVTIERVERFTEVAQSAVEQTAAELERMGGDADLDYWAASLYGRMELTPQIRAMKVGFADGDSIELRRTEEGFVLHAYTLGGDGTTETRQYNAYFGLVDRTVGEVDRGADARLRPWYQAAIAADGTTWTVPYLEFATGDQGVSGVRAARIEGDVFAVAAADLSLEGLSAVLDGLPLGTDGQAFVLDSLDVVVAAPGSFADQMDSLRQETGAVPTAQSLGLTDVPGSATSGPDGAFGWDGQHMILERPFPAGTGPSWSIQVRATRAGLAPDVTAVQRTVLWTAGIAAVLVVAFLVLAIRIWRPLERMQKRATRDALTGLSNRYDLRSRGQGMLDSVGTGGEAVCVIAFDLDGLKELNDTRGHPAGDRALVTTAKVLAAHTRPRDIVARLGGDEFVVARRSNGDDDVAAAVDRLRSAVSTRLSQAFPKGTGVGITAGWALSQGGKPRFDELHRRADAALVQGKATAKGRTYRWTKPEAVSPKKSPKT